MLENLEGSPSGSKPSAEHSGGPARPQRLLSNPTLLLAAAVFSLVSVAWQLVTVSEPQGYHKTGLQGFGMLALAGACLIAIYRRGGMAWRVISGALGVAVAGVAAVTLASVVMSLARVL